MRTRSRQPRRLGWAVKTKVKSARFIEAEFNPPVEAYAGKIVEVRLGATKGEGGTRGKSVTVGGELAPAFYTVEKPMPNPPVVAVDVFDMETSLPETVEMHVRDVLEDSAAWAELAVEKFEADLVALHLTSTGPLLNNASPREAVRTVEEVAQAVDVPLIICGCGDPVKDANVFEAVAETFAGERFLFSSITGDMDVERCAGFIKRHGHVVLSSTRLNLDLARQLNHQLCNFLPKEDIIMDLGTAALGHGLGGLFSTMGKARLAALMGDQELAHPMSSTASTAWTAKEARTGMAPEWEPRELRGPLWELITALTLLLAGVDLIMMMHPAAVKALKKITTLLLENHVIGADKIMEWCSVKT